MPFLHFRFHGKVGRQQTIRELEFLWVNSVFKKTYVLFLRGNEGKWIGVPEGHSRAPCNSLPIPGPTNWSPPVDTYPLMWLRQTPECDVCAYTSIASALHHAGDHVTAQKLKTEVEKGHGYIINNSDKRKWMNIRNTSPNTKQLKYHEEINIPINKNTFCGVSSVILFGSDGSCNHRVAILVN